MTKIKYALIGFGGIAENRIAKEGFACDKNRFNGLENAELIGAFDLNAARKEAAEALNLKWYTSVDELLADNSIDAVFVATNNLTHAELAIKAMNAKKHVIVEKPLATSIEDAEKMIECAKKNNVSLTVDHMMVYNAWTQKAKTMVAENALGAINDCCFHMEFACGYTEAEAKSWRCSNIKEMGGPIGDVASHCFYVSEYIFNDVITEVAAVYLPKLMSIKAEDGAYIKFKMSSGLSGSVKVAFSERRGGLGGTISNLGYEIYGDQAVLRNYGGMFQLSGHPDEPVKIRMEKDVCGEVETIKITEIANIYQQLIENHAKSVKTGNYLNAEDALHNLQLCEASHKSAQNNGEIIIIS
ncbi:MAG: Gfo/Idh/MocA family oxidoreductase [Lentisphaeria bacterium]|nr:Gfo/Idh/MocA family oxidoreductase [Lentisphaeria bacterium]